MDCLHVKIYRETPNMIRLENQAIKGMVMY